MIIVSCKHGRKAFRNRSAAASFIRYVRRLDRTVKLRVLYA